MRLLFLVVSVLFSGILLHPGLSMAQEVLENFKEKTLPKIPPIPASKFEAKTALKHEKPMRIKEIAFKLRVPMEWETGTKSSVAELDSKLLTELVRYTGPADLDGRPWISVQAAPLNFDVTAEQWLLQYLLSSGYSVEGMKVYDENRVEVLYVMLEGDLSYIARSMVIINGPYVLVATYVIPYNQFQKMGQMQAQCIGTFDVESKSVAAAELRKTYQFLDIAQVNYPNSWMVKTTPVRTMDRMSTRLYSTSSLGTTEGEIEIDMVSASVVSSLEQDIQAYKQALLKRSLVFGERLEEKKGFSFHRSISFGAVEVYKVVEASNQLVDYELWFSLLGGKGYYVFVSMLTPSRNAEVSVWSRNTEAYKTVVESISMLEGSLTED